MGASAAIANAAYATGEWISALPITIDAVLQA